MSKWIPIIVLAWVIMLAVFVGSFLWYATTVIPHTYPTPYTGFGWGLVHGFFVGPTFIWSLFSHDVTIYQSPNTGGWYNFGYVIGLAIVCVTGGLAASSRHRYAEWG